MIWWFMCATLSYVTHTLLFFNVLKPITNLLKFIKCKMVEKKSAMRVMCVSMYCTGKIKHTHMRRFGVFFSCHIDRLKRLANWVICIMCSKQVSKRSAIVVIKICKQNIQTHQQHGYMAVAWRSRTKREMFIYLWMWKMLAYFLKWNRSISNCQGIAKQDWLLFR